MPLTEETVMPKDIEKAASEQRNIYSNMSRIEEAIFIGDLEIAKQATHEMYSAILALEKMVQRKQEFNRLAEAVKELNIQQVNASLVSRVMGK